MSFAFIPCTLNRGFFDTELYVMVGDSSAIVDRRILQIQNEPAIDAEGAGLVRVLVVDRQPERALVELPGESVVGSLRTWIPAGVLQEAA